MGERAVTQQDRTSAPAGAGSEESINLFVTVRKLLDTEIRPYVQSDGGDIELLAVEGNVVKVRLLGACVTCPSSMSTLKGGVQARLQAKISKDIIVEEVLDKK